MTSGTIFVLTGPSGVGKGTICKLLLEALPFLRLSISATSREPRPGETHGVHYFFLKPEVFEEMIATGDFLEWAQYNGNFYGTPKFAVETLINEGQDVILEIETQGALMVKQLFPDACLIFITPPSWEALEARLRGRETESEEQINRRLAIAESELVLQDQFDYIVENDQVDACTQTIITIVRTLSKNA